MPLPSLHDAKDFAELVCALCGTAVSLGVGVYLRKMKRVGKAIVHAPELLHDHEETEGTLTAEGVRYFEPRA